MSALRDAALDYARRGFKVFPLAPRSKVPRAGSHGFKDASSDVAQVAAWWDAEPDANVGIATGHDGVFVLDVDPEKGGRESVEKLRPKEGWPRSLFSKTGSGGMHFFFRSAAAVDSPQSILPGLDVRGKLGYVVAPPSVHPSGGVYEWATNEDIAEAPASVVEFILGKQTKKKQAPPVASGDAVPEGRRNETMFQLARSLWGAGLSEPAVYAAAVADNNARFRPPMSDKEVRQAVAQGRKYANDNGTPEPPADRFDAPDPEEPFRVYEPPIDYSHLLPAPVVEGREREPGNPDPPRVTGRDLSDIGNARLMATKAARLRYAPSLGWLYYAGGVWNIDAGDVFATRIAAEVLDEKFLMAGANVVAANRLPEGDERKVAVAVAEAEAAWYRSSRKDKKRLAAMLSIGGTVPGVTVDAADLDRDPWLLNVANGTVDLRTGRLRPHDPSDLITHQAPVAYDKKAVARRWLKYLEEVFRGDAELIEFVRRWIGYCLTGSVKEQKFVLFNGVGANGKSLLFKVLAALFGSYATPIDVETTLVARDKGGGGPRADIMDLRGARLAYASEFSDGHKLAVRFIKSLTGGEKLAARAPYAKAYVKFDPTVKMVVATNFLPEVSGSDPALWRRLRVVPFEQTFYGKADDKNLFETLVDELPGIMVWAVVGCLAWQKEGGLGESSAVTEAGQAYRSEQDVVGRFIAERCERDAAAWVGRDLVFEEFTKWCATENEPAGTAKRFAQQLKLHGIKDGGKRGIGGAGGVRIWSGLRVVGTGHRSHTSPPPDAPSETVS